MRERLASSAPSFQLEIEKMELHNRLTSRQLELQFQHGILHPSIFTHEAHLRIAYIHIARYGLERAINNAITQVPNYLRAIEKGLKYDKDITISSVKLVHHYMQQSTCDNFYDFIQEFPELKHNFSELLGFFHAYTSLFQSQGASTNPENGGDLMEV